MAAIIGAKIAKLRMLPKPPVLNALMPRFWRYCTMYPLPPLLAPKRSKMNTTHTHAKNTFTLRSARISLSWRYLFDTGIIATSISIVSLHSRFLKKFLLYLGADTGSRTQLSALGRLHISRYTIPARVGAICRDRTGDLRVTNALLYQLS